MIITISGLPGSGKSTVGKIIAKKLNYEYMSVGDFRGRMAMDRGITLDELNQLGEEESWTDEEADKYQVEYAKTHDNLVIEGRMSFHFIPDSFKIFITVDLKTAAERTLQNREDRKDEAEVSGAAEAEELLRGRIESDKKRYLKYYGVDYTDPKHYNLVVDATTPSAEEIAEIILDKKTEIS
jgi:cytidylate kinase